MCCVARRRSRASEGKQNQGLVMGILGVMYAVSTYSVLPYLSKAKRGVRVKRPAGIPG